MLNVMDRFDRSRQVAAALPAQGTDHAVLKAIQLLAGQRHTLTLGAVLIGCSTTVVPLMQQTRFQL